jgi:hypothetical protein
MNRLHIAGLGFLAAIYLLSLAPAARAQDDRDNVADTGWQIKTKMTGAELSTLCSDNNLRIVDINVDKVVNKKGSIFDAVLVPNTGDFEKTWQFQWGITPEDLGNYANAHNLRPIDVAPYEIGGILYLAVVMISNTGIDAANWELAWGGTASAVIPAADLNGALRLIQLKNYTYSGSTYYLALGRTKDSRSVQYLPAATYSTISADLVGGFRVVTLMPDTGGTFDAILDNEDVGGYGWYFGEDEEFIFDVATGNGFRPSGLARDGAGTFAATYIPD